MRPEYYAESSGVSHKPIEQDVALAHQHFEPDSVAPSMVDEQIHALYTPEQSTPDHTASGPYFVSLDANQDVRELYSARDIELAQVVARRIKLGMFATRKAREELDREIDVRVWLYEKQAGLVDRLQIEAWKMHGSDIEEEELTRRLAEHHIEQERLHETHINEAFRQIQRFGVLSAWNDALSEWYVGLSREYRIGVALGVTAVSSAMSGMAAWSAESLGPTAAVIGGGMLAGAKLYKVYNQARLGIYKDWGQEEKSSEDEEIASGPAENTGRKRRLGRAALESVRQAKTRWNNFTQKLFNRKKATAVSEADSLDEGGEDEDDRHESQEAIHSSEELYVEVMSRMERRRRERVEHADRVNKRARIILIGAGVLTAIGIGGRFIDFGKIVDWFNGGPPVGGVPSSSPTPIPTGVTPSPSETPTTPTSPPPSPPVGPLPQPPELPPAPPQPEYSKAALTVEDGEGWYQTLSELGITNATEQANLLNRIGPRLVEPGWAYIMPDGSYGISEPGALPRQALDLIAGSR